MRKSNSFQDEEIYKKVSFDELFKRIAVVYVVIVVTIVGGIGIYSFIENQDTTEAIRETQLEGTPLGKKLQKAADTIQDCVEPSGKCFQDGAKRTSAAVESIGDIVAITIVCADEVGTQEYIEIKKCVDKKITELTK